MFSRRNFLNATAATGAAAMILKSQPAKAADDRPNIIGPRTGYSPQIGTLVSTLAWVQRAIPGTVKGLTTTNLDYLLDSHANTIGALLLHLAATETYYQLNTFDGMKWDSWPAAVKQKWDAAMNLGDEGRASIKGHDLDYYLGVLKEVREKSLAEFQKRDDKWLMTVDEQWFWGPTNNYCKWFHVCEHISHHVGQMAMLRARAAGARA
jgi:hypothetical protein